MTAVKTVAALSEYPTLAALRVAHEALLQSPADRQNILKFLQAGERTGAILQVRSERSAAQALLDYWIGVLYAAPPSRNQEPVPDVMLAPFDPAAAPDLSDKLCPFMGLAAFLEGDAERFYGRDDSIEQLSKRVQERPVVVVSGPSGGGKSSLVLAGLLAKLKAQTPADGKRWCFLPSIVPGNEPLLNLAKAFCPAGADPGSWGKEQREKLRALASHVTELASELAAGRPILLIVDQFEELFTLSTDSSERKAYAEALLALASGSNHVVLTIREDYLPEAAQLPGMKPVLNDQSNRFTPPPMSARDLRRVIERPAALVGLKFDEGIVDDLVKEVAGEPTALPLLQFTLLRLWENRDRNRISWNTYRRVGKPREALKQTADAIYEGLPEDLDRQVAERVFLELVQPSVGIEFVRRRVRRDWLWKLTSTVVVDRVLERFVRAGLIRVCGGSERDDDRFEVAHEALIRNWPRLANWLEAKRQIAVKEIQFATTARLWKESGQKGYLLSGEALTDAVRFAEASPLIAEFVGASQREEGRRNRRWRRALIICIAVLALGCLSLGFLARFAQVQSESAYQQSLLATKEAKRARDAEIAATTLRDEALELKIVAEEKQKKAEDLAEKLNRTAESYLGRSKLAEAGLLIASDPDLGKATWKQNPEVANALKTLAEYNSTHGKEIGYAEAFLGSDAVVPLPKISTKHKVSAFDNGTPLHHLHYSVVLNKERRFAFYSAANLNRAQREVVPRPNTKWRSDPQAPEEVQSADELYKNSDLNRGLLTRRNSLSWGANSKEASNEAFLFTNTCPMFKSLNIDGYSKLDTWIQEKFLPDAQRVCLFSGPVFREDDYVFRGYQIPRAYWKVAVARNPQGGRMVASAFLMEHYKQETAGAEPEYIRYSAVAGEFNPRRFQVTVSQLEQLTGLNLGVLRQVDDFSHPKNDPPAARR